MEKRDASLDASFWINGYHAGLLDFLTNHFNLFAPSAVVEEIEHPSSVTGRLRPTGAVFREWRRVGRITLQEPHRPVDWFHPGENAAIALALERGCVLLIDDHNPYHLAKAQGIKVTSTADFAVMLYVHRRLALSRTQAILRQLEVNRHLMRAALITLELVSRARGDKQ